MHALFRPILQGGAHAGWPAGWLGGRLAGWLAGHQNARKTRTLNTKMRQKRAPLRRKSMSEMPTWHPVVNKHVQKCTCPPAAILSNKLYRGCSISTRVWATGWVGAKLAGWLAGWLRGRRFTCKQSARAPRFTRVSNAPTRAEKAGAKCTCPPAAILSNKLYRGCSICTKAWAAGWLGAWLAGWLAGWPAGWLVGPQMRQKRKPSARKSVENAYP